MKSVLDDFKQSRVNLRSRVSNLRLRVCKWVDNQLNQFCCDSTELIEGFGAKFSGKSRNEANFGSL